MFCYWYILRAWKIFSYRRKWLFSKAVITIYAFSSNVQTLVTDTVNTSLFSHILCLFFQLIMCVNKTSYDLDLCFPDWHWCWISFHMFVCHAWFFFFCKMLIYISCPFFKNKWFVYLLIYVILHSDLEILNMILLVCNLLSFSLSKSDLDEKISLNLSFLCLVLDLSFHRSLFPTHTPMVN